MSSGTRKSPNAFRTISEVAESMDIPQHVLRFWESKFTQINPMKRGGGRRYYRPEDVEIISAIRQLLHEDGYTIKGAQKYLREHGVANVLKNFKVDQEHHSPSGDNNLPSEEKSLLPDAEKNIGGRTLAPSLRTLRNRLETIRRNLHKART